MDDESKLRLLPGGILYYGDVRLPFRIHGGTLSVRVKEKWLQPEYGRFVEIEIDELLALDAAGGSCHKAQKSL